MFGLGKPSWGCVWYRSRDLQGEDAARQGEDEAKQGEGRPAPHSAMFKHELQSCLCGPFSLLKPGFTAPRLLLPRGAPDVKKAAQPLWLVLAWQTPDMAAFDPSGTLNLPGKVE